MSKIAVGPGEEEERPVGRLGLVAATSRLFFTLMRDYLGIGRRRRAIPITDRAGLEQFLETRASLVAQTSLYGYLRTRAGTRYRELFESDVFLVSINLAKWHIWLACLSDLAVFAGGLLRRHPEADDEAVGGLIAGAVAAILERTGVPDDADAEFPAHADRVRARIAATAWNEVSDDGGPFSESPAALYRWAPVIDDLKQLDEEIVRNSVRFRWQEIRRDLRRDLQVDDVMTAGPPETMPAEPAPT